ncbi:hypothetical protein CAOG_03085 [Capsaspora owczarzaki ATCC 30864]|nr:hypothetical protein CAOG_03085 [Capsaspora owczarzaki ATCC 30864]|eukprot:XP_004363924.1 hypothetical protein CAOG_03085 [Capsaspora owczarzaki ATCC 30864]
MAEPMNIDLAAAAAAAAAGTAEASSAVADTRILAEPEQQHAAASSTAPAAIESAATTEASGAAAAETETGKVIYRLKLGGFPNKGASQAVVMALVSNLKLNPIAVFKKPVYTTATVTFATPEERDHAISVLNGRTFQNSALVAEVTSDFVERVSTSDRGAKRQGKRAAEEPAGDNPEKRVRAASPEAIRIMLNDNVTPYWQKPYEEQLALKQADMLSVVKKYSSTMTAKHGKNDNWSPKEDGSLFCEMQPIRASPVLTEYRNKCEFSIGMGHDGSRNMVGFLLGAFKNGFFSLAPVDECLHVSPIAKRVASAMQTFLNTESKADGYDKVTHEGFWRQILVRDSTLGELLAVVQYAPFADSAATQTELDKLHQYFLKLKQDRTLPLTTLMTQVW